MPEGHLLPSLSQEDIKDILALRAVADKGSAPDLDEEVVSDLCPDFPKVKTMPGLEDTLCVPIGESGVQSL